MAEPTVSDVLKKVDDTIAAVQDAQATVVEFTGKLETHNADEDAHCWALKKIAQLGTMGAGLKLDADGHPTVDVDKLNELGIGGDVDEEKR